MSELTVVEPDHWAVVFLDPEAVKVAFDRLCARSGVDVRLGAAEAKTTPGAAWHRRLYIGSTNVWPISHRAIRSAAPRSAALKRSIGSHNGSKLSRNV